LASDFKTLLAPTGSIVLEIGNAWEPGKPVMSSTPLKALLAFLDHAGLFLCQEFIWYNNARLPGPAQWVNVDRIRVKDAFTRIWWMSLTTTPKANNRRVLVDYSESMKKLLRTKKYNAGKRPSEHKIGKESFLKNHNGAIPSNVLIGPNTKSTGDYYKYCHRYNLPMHPARMPPFIAEFFISLLTTKGDLVLDPFGGSNTTGYTAENLGRKWVTVETDLKYVKGSKGRFPRRKFRKTISG